MEYNDDISTRVALSVDYESTPGSAWRCDLYVLFHHPVSMAILFVGAVIQGIVIGALLSHWGLFVGILGFVLGVAVGAGIQSTLLVLRLREKFQQRFRDRTAIRLCKTSLTPLGIRDEMPEKTSLLRWNDIRVIREHHGDVHIWSGLQQLNHIPKHAFAADEDCRRFCAVARSLWKARGANWDEVSRENGS